MAGTTLLLEIMLKEDRNTVVLETSDAFAI
jgi:hypothetical protein